MFSSASFQKLLILVLWTQPIAGFDVASTEQPLVPREVAKIGSNGLFTAPALLDLDRFCVDVGVNKEKVLMP